MAVLCLVQSMNYLDELSLQHWMHLVDIAEEDDSDLGSSSEDLDSTACVFWYQSSHIGGIYQLELYFPGIVVML